RPSRLVPGPSRRAGVRGPQGLTDPLASRGVRHHASHMEPQVTPTPGYNHLLEVLDGAASLRMAILQAEEALMEPDLEAEDRSLLESVLEASRDRMSRVISALEQPNLDAFEAGPSGPGDQEWSDHELIDAGRAARDGSEDAERDAARAIDRLGRS